jgi:hypothetical protein
MSDALVEQRPGLGLRRAGFGALGDALFQIGQGKFGHEAN